MSKLFAFKNYDWKEGKTQKGLRRFYKLWANVWLNVVILQNNKLFIIYGGEKIKNNLIWDEGKKNIILKEVEELLTGAEPKAFEDMSPHEKLVEIGRRENIKYNKQINKFGDGYDC